MINHDIIGKYEIRKSLGHSPVGTTYLAYDPDMRTEVSLVFAQVELGNRDKNLDFHKLFLKEANQARQILHPNICVILDVGEHEGIPFVAMEHFAAAPLSSLLKSDHLGDVHRRIHLLEQMAKGMLAAHRKNVVHGALTPQNILVSDQGEVKITDWALAKLMDDLFSGQGSMLAPPMYTPPEKFTGQAVDEQGDLYALSVIAHELLTDDAPFPSDSVFALMNKILNDPPMLKTVKGLDPRANAAVETFFEMALEKLPKHRFQDAGTWLNALTHALQGDLVPALKNFKAEKERTQPSRAAQSTAPPPLPQAGQDSAPSTPIASQAQAGAAPSSSKKSRKKKTDTLEIPIEDIRKIMSSKPKPTESAPPPAATATATAAAAAPPPLPNAVQQPKASNSEKKSKLPLLPWFALGGAVLFLLVVVTFLVLRPKSNNQRAEQIEQPPVVEQEVAQTKPEPEVMVPEPVVPSLIQLDSIPTDVSVFLDGSFVGTTPISLDPGEWAMTAAITLNCPDYENVTVDFDPAALPEGTVLVELPIGENDSWLDVLDPVHSEADSGPPAAEEADDLSEEERLWRLAVRDNRVNSYRSYLKFYPNGRYAPEARKRRDRMQRRQEFSVIFKTKDRQAIKSYIQAHPGLLQEDPRAMAKSLTYQFEDETAIAIRSQDVDELHQLIMDVNPQVESEVLEKVKQEYTRLARSHISTEEFSKLITRRNFAELSKYLARHKVDNSRTEKAKQIVDQMIAERTDLLSKTLNHVPERKTKLKSWRKNSFELSFNLTREPPFPIKEVICQFSIKGDKPKDGIIPLRVLGRKFVQDIPFDELETGKWTTTW